MLFRSPVFTMVDQTDSTFDMSSKMIIALKKENDNLKQENLNHIEDKQTIEATYKKKIKELRENLKITKEDYLLAVKNNKELAEYENKFHEAKQQKERLEQVAKEVSDDYEEAIIELHESQEKVTSLERKCESLENGLVGESVLLATIETLRQQQRELQEKLANHSLLCINPAYATGEDRMWILHPALTQEMSLCEELEEASMNNVEVPSDPSSDLIPAVAEAASQTEPDIELPKPRMCNKGTQIGFDEYYLLRPRTCLQPSVRVRGGRPGDVQSRLSHQRTSLQPPFKVRDAVEEPRPRVPDVLEDFVVPLRILRCLSYVLRASFYFFVAFLLTLFVIFTFFLTVEDFVHPVSNWVAQYLRNNVKLTYTQMPPH